jgi:hypothetical protein
MAENNSIFNRDDIERASVVGVTTIINHVRKGATLHKVFRSKARGGTTEILYFLEPSGIPVRARDAVAAISSGRLEPAADGLFGDSQTWTYRPMQKAAIGLRRRTEAAD